LAGAINFCVVRIHPWNFPWFPVQIDRYREIRVDLVRIRLDRWPESTKPTVPSQAKQSRYKKKKAAAARTRAPAILRWIGMDL
jgi:hypothetical protein